VKRQLVLQKGYYFVYIKAYIGLSAVSVDECKFYCARQKILKLPLDNESLQSVHGQLCLKTFVPEGEIFKLKETVTMG
jgi:hypothetical protein